MMMKYLANVALCVALLVTGATVVSCGGSSTPADVCVTTTACATNDDCDTTQHCNLALNPPVCQTLFCGGLASLCSEPALCANQTCPYGYCTCEPVCTDLECGEDPVCGLSCGTCDTGFGCDAGLCVERPCVPDCTGLTCGQDPVCGSNCGSCDTGFGCESGTCVALVVEAETVLIPAGPFWMGCNTVETTDCNGDQKPYHEVTLSAYKMDKTEVTVAKYGECVTAGECTIPNIDTGVYCNWGVSGTENHPVNCVDWNQADAYCTWAGKRLPTEAEWEKAARGTDGRKYPWGMDEPTCDFAVMNNGSNGCGIEGTSEVCSKSPAGDSPYGLCDMAGNVWEWVGDWYDSEYYAGSPATDPAGPESGGNRVVRGGSYKDSEYIMRTHHRNFFFPALFNPDFNLGFRCASDVQ